MSRQNRAEVQGTADCCADSTIPRRVIPRAWAEAQLDWAYGAASIYPPEVRAEDLHRAGILSQMEQPRSESADVGNSCVALPMRFDYYAEAAGETRRVPCQRQTIIDGRALLTREVKRFEAEVAAIIQRSENRQSRRRCGLPHRMRSPSG